MTIKAAQSEANLTGAAFTGYGWFNNQTISPPEIHKQLAIVYHWGQVLSIVKRGNLETCFYFLQ
jgi:hypothetical protein